MREDPRRDRTREALGSALVRLLEHESLEAMSVAQLCREAGVHRTTFYGHADSVDAFAVAYLTRDLDALSAVEPASGDPHAVAGEYLAALTSTLAHVAASRGVFRAMFSSTSRGAFRGALEERLRDRARLALAALDELGAPGLPSGERDREESAAFVAGGLVGVIEAWTREDDDDADAASRRVLALMPRWWPLRG